MYKSYKLLTGILLLLFSQSIHAQTLQIEGNVSTKNKSLFLTGLLSPSKTPLKAP